MPSPVRALIIVAALVLMGCGGAPTPSTPTTPATAAAPATPSAPAARTSAPASGPAATPIGQTERATVVRVVDGDTIIVDRGRGNERVRYLGVDTPESVKPDTPVEFMAQEATAENARLVEGRAVLMETDVSDTDRFDRLLRYVWVEDPDRPGSLRMVNLELVARGFAQVVTYPPDVRYADTLLDAQQAARDQGLGLWGDPTTAP